MIHKISESNDKMLDEIIRGKDNNFLFRDRGIIFLVTLVRDICRIFVVMLVRGRRILVTIVRERDIIIIITPMYQRQMNII